MESSKDSADTSASSGSSSDQLSTNAAPPAAASASSTLIGHIEQAGKTELVALKPLVAAIVRKFVASWESQHGGILGKIEAHLINAVVDSAFGPAPTE